MTKTVLQLGVFLSLALSSFATFGQAPAQFNFQGVARNDKGVVISAKPIALRFSIRTGSADGSLDYQEQRSVSTDSNGVFNAVIGGANATNVEGNLSAVLWTTGAKFLQVEMDAANGTAFVNLGATQLLSVPYALFSNNSFNSGYANSSGSYFFEAFFPSRFISARTNSLETIVFPNTKYDHLDRTTGKSVYDSTSGVFTAPEDGIYQFDFFATSGDDDPIGNGFLYLLRNQQIEKRITELRLDDYRADDLDDYGYELHTRIYLKKGDRISIAFQNEAEYETGINSGSYFSGYKIY